MLKDGETDGDSVATGATTLMSNLSCTQLIFAVVTTVTSSVSSAGVSNENPTDTLVFPFAFLCVIATMSSGQNDRS